MGISNVCVIGCGLMGRQIALNAALHGFRARAFDSSQAARADTERWAADYLAGRVAKGRLTQEQADAAAGQFAVSPTLEHACDGADMVIEAIIEDVAAKTELLRRVSALVRGDSIIATNSSYMPSSMFAGCVSSPGRLLNLHYFNPALVMKVVEVVGGEHTLPETVATAADFVRAVGKQPVILSREIEGFVVNRILRAIKDEAYSLLESGIATAQDIDAGVELGLGHPMGPFRLTDLTGIDLNYAVNERRLKETGEKPPGYDTVKRKYEAGQWGRKSGRGFYEYD